MCKNSVFVVLGTNSGRVVLLSLTLENRDAVGSAQANSRSVSQPRELFAPQRLWFAQSRKADHSRGALCSGFIALITRQGVIGVWETGETLMRHNNLLVQKDEQSFWIYLGNQWAAVGRR